MAELPLILFTLCMQAAIGTMVFMMLAKLMQKNQEYKIAATVAALLSIIGVIASLAHLGSPLKALNSLANIGSSWLSREVLFSGAFMGLTVLYAVILYIKPKLKAVLNTLGWAASIVGLLDVFMMAKVYTWSSVPAWQGTNAFVDFYATMIVLGIAMLFLTSVTKLDNRILGYFGITAVVMVAVQVAFAIPYYVNLGLMGGAAAVSAGILSNLNGLVITQWLLLVLGAGLLLYTKGTNEKTSFTKYYVTATALSIGLIIGRYLFYAISVASEVGLT